MEIIEKMEDNTFDDILDAGVELVAALVPILQKRGLGLEHASAVVAVAAAGIAKGSNLRSGEVAEMVDAVISMWREQERDGQSGVVFDPPHRRPGFVAQERDTKSEN